jgi:NAD+ kinase
MPTPTAISHVGICVKPGSPQAAQAALEVADWLGSRGVGVLADRESAAALGIAGAERAVLAEKADLLVVLGGDGTILSVARAVGERRVPILGVNLGTLGFLAEVAPDEMFAMLERVLAEELQVVPRMRLQVRACRGERELMRELALNDAVLTRSDLSRMIDLEARSDGVPVTTYHGDGLIVATPTGSTAYTLSAGGPILMPGSQVFVVTPICPHTLSQRPLVFSDRAILEIDVYPRDGSCQLTVDGQVGAILEDGDRVTVECSEHPAHFVTARANSQFGVLRTKLGWGAG